MDFVTFSDHDTVDGCLAFQDRHPDLTDFFVSEEVETFFPRTGHRFTSTSSASRSRSTRSSRRSGEHLRPRGVPPAEKLLSPPIILFQFTGHDRRPRLFTTMLALFDVFEVKNGSIGLPAQRPRRGSPERPKQKRGSLALVAGRTPAHLRRSPPSSRWRRAGHGKAFLASIREGGASRGGRDGLRPGPRDVYENLGSTTAPSRVPEPRLHDRRKARHFVIAAASLPSTSPGFPQAIIRSTTPSSSP